MEFRRVDSLPPYVFAVIRDLTLELRRAGDDVVDLGFGNPDLPSPDLAVEKLGEAAQNPRNHRYSASKGIPNLRLAAATLYKRKFGVDLDPETQVLNTIGAKEGFSHLMWVLLEPGDSALVPSPSYPIHIQGPIFAGASVTRVPMGADEDLFANLEEAWERAQPKPRVVVLSFPHNPTTATVDLAFMERVVAFAREHELLVVHDFAYADLAFDGYEPPSILQVPGADGGRGRALHADEVVLDGGLARRLRRRQRRRRRRARAPQVVARLRHLPADPDRGDRGDERAARLPARGVGDLPVAPRRALRRARPRRLVVPEAEGDDVRLGADPGAVRVARVARLRREARAGGERRRLARASASAPTATGSCGSRSSRTSTASARPCAGSGSCWNGAPSRAPSAGRRAAQVGVVAAHPVVAHGGEDVEHDGVLERLDRVRDARSG